MDKDSALRIVNVVYSVMLGFVVNHLLLIKDAPWPSGHLTWIDLILIVYYICDWFSFNALTSLDKTHQHVEMFFSIVFIFFLGWLIVRSNHLTNENVHSFILWASIYFAATTAFFLGRMSLTWTPEAGAEGLIKDVWVKADFILRLIIGVGGVFYSANRTDSVPVEHFATCKIIFACACVLILVVKYARYLNLLKRLKPATS